MARLITIAIAALLAPTALAQPLPDLRPLGPVIEAGIDAASRATENETGEDLTGEDVDLALAVNVVHADFDLLGVVLAGGGKAESDFVVTGHFEFRAIALERVAEMLNETSVNASIEETFGVSKSRVVLLAEEFRLLAGGAVLEAFRSAEERAAVAFVQSSLPGVTVLSSAFEWSNLAPAARARDGERPALREPPIVLDARLDVRYLARVSLADLLGLATDEDDAAEAEEDALKERLKAAASPPAIEQSAYAIAGIDHLLALDVPPGWRLNLSFTVPKGFTIEEATDDLAVTRDRRTASYYADGTASSGHVAAAAVVTISSRPLVTAFLLAALLVLGVALRAVVEAAALTLAWRGERRRRRVTPRP